MGIDRPEDGDTPDDAPARPAGRDAGPLSDPSARMTEQPWDRGTVEKVYAAARDDWAGAIPALCAAWAQHERNYPERTRLTPRTRPDGSWADGGTRELTPEQNAEATKACADTRDEGREIVLPAMRRVEAADPGRRLAGLKNMLKGEDRLKEKIADALQARPGLTIRQALSIVPDPVRFTFAYGAERYTAGVRADVERLKAEGFELIKLKNLWADDQYKGINSQWRRPETGLRFEMQFHTPESLEAKELTHKAYERIRGAQASPAERRELEDFQRRVNVLIATPSGTAEIKDFPEKNNG